MTERLMVVEDLDLERGPSIEECMDQYPDFHTRIFRQWLMDALYKGANEFHLTPTKKGEMRIHFRIAGKLYSVGTMPPVLRVPTMEHLRERCEIGRSEKSGEFSFASDTKNSAVVAVTFSNARHGKKATLLLNEKEGWSQDFFAYSSEADWR